MYNLHLCTPDSHFPFPHFKFLLLSSLHSEQKMHANFSLIMIINILNIFTLTIITMILHRFLRHYLLLLLSLILNLNNFFNLIITFSYLPNTSMLSKS